MAKARKTGRGKAMGARAAETARAARGRTGPETTPVYFRGAVDGDGTVDRDFIRNRLGDKLGKYANRIDRLDVALATNAPARGSAGKRITIEAKVARNGPVAVTASGENTREAFLAANRAIERSIRRWIERTRSVRRSAGR